MCWDLGDYVMNWSWLVRTNQNEAEKYKRKIVYLAVDSEQVLIFLPHAETLFYIQIAFKSTWDS